MRSLLALSLLLVGMVARGEILKVVDAEDSTPLKAATVFSKSGAIIGLTDDNGEIKIASQTDYPLFISYLGYKAAKYSDNGPGIVRMEPTAYDLSEVVINPADRPVERIVCYMREYMNTTGTKDTVIYYNEFMADFFFVKGKVKGFKTRNSPRLLCSRHYAKICNKEGEDSVFCPKYQDSPVAWTQLVTLPETSFDVSQMINEGKTYCTTNGKYSLKEQVRINPTTVMKTVDFLADYKNHSMSPLLFKMLGFTLDITEGTGTWLYRRNDNGVSGIDDFLMGTITLEMLGRGKWIKKAFHTDQDVDIYASYEVYPVSIEYLSVQDAKDLLENKPQGVKITLSPNVLPLRQEIREIVEAAEKGAM